MEERVVHATHVALQSAARTLAADVERLRILAELTYLREREAKSVSRERREWMLTRIARLEGALWGE